MSRDEWNALVEQARACDMLKLAAAHGAKLSRYGHGGEYVGGCPVCGTGRDRFSINTKKGVFNCRVCGQGGHGAIDLEMFLGGCEFVEAVKWLTNTTALNGQHRPTARNPEAAAALERERERDEAEQREVAAWLWSLRRPAAGSPVEPYVRGRGYAGIIPPTIGYLPARGEYAHAMISAFALPNEIEPGELGAPLAVCSVHLTKLLPDGADRVREGQGKIIVGRPLGLPIAVSCIGDGLSLAVTEGVEDALAYADIGIGAWAAGAAFYMPTLAAHIPDYVTSLTIEKHIDVSERAQQAVERAVAQLQTLIHQRPLREGERPIKINIRKASA